MLKLRILRTISREPMDTFLWGMQEFVKAEHLSLAKEQDKLREAPPDNMEEGWLATLFDDDHYFLDEAEKLSHELAIVALYKIVEINSKRAIKAAFPDAPAKELFRINELKKFLRGKGVNITKLKHYKSMNEVRCISNCIKHDGFVDSKLAAYPGWILGKPLENLDRAYYRLVPECEGYIAELIDALTARYAATRQIRKKITRPD
jgi:hypothetical protein